MTIFKVYDDGSNTFSLIEGLTGFENCIMQLDDIDKDNGMAIFIAGTQSGVKRTKLYLNTTILLSVASFSNIPSEIYPNPASDFIRIKGLLKPEKIKITNVLGIEIKHGIIINDNEKINVQNLSDGLYILTFENGKSIKFLKKWYIANRTFSISRKVSAIKKYRKISDFYCPTFHILTVNSKLKLN